MTIYYMLGSKKIMYGFKRFSFHIFLIRKIRNHIEFYTFKKKVEERLIQQLNSNLCIKYLAKNKISLNK